MTERGPGSLDRALEGSEILEIARLDAPARLSGPHGPGALAGRSPSRYASRRAGADRVPDERRLPPAVSDLVSFLHALGSERRVLPFPAFALDPYRGLSPHLDVVAARLKALAAIVAGAGRGGGRERARRSCTARRSPRCCEARFRTLRPKDIVDPLELERFFVLGGYRYEDPVTTPGDFTRRGGILDVFPPASEWPIRLELLGDEIDEIRTFDPESQRARETLAEAKIGPASEWPVSETDLSALGGDEAAGQGGRGIPPSHSSAVPGEPLRLPGLRRSLDRRGARVDRPRGGSGVGARPRELRRIRRPRPLAIRGAGEAAHGSRRARVPDRGTGGEPSRDGDPRRGDTHHLSTHILPSYRGASVGVPQRSPRATRLRPARPGLSSAGKAWPSDASSSSPRRASPPAAPP